MGTGITASEFRVHGRRVVVLRNDGCLHKNSPKSVP